LPTSFFNRDLWFKSLASITSGGGPLVSHLYFQVEVMEKIN